MPILNPSLFFSNLIHSFHLPDTWLMIHWKMESEDNLFIQPISKFTNWFYICHQKLCLPLRPVLFAKAKHPLLHWIPLSFTYQKFLNLLSPLLLMHPQIFLQPMNILPPISKQKPLPWTPYFPPALVPFLCEEKLRKNSVYFLSSFPHFHSLLHLFLPHHQNSHISHQWAPIC